MSRNIKNAGELSSANRSKNDEKLDKKMALKSFNRTPRLKMMTTLSPSVVMTVVPVSRSRKSKSKSKAKSKVKSQAKSQTPPKPSVKVMPSTSPPQESIKLKEIEKVPQVKRIASDSEMQKQEHKVEPSKGQDSVEYVDGKDRDGKILFCEKIILEKLTPRYRLNLLKVGLNICRYVCKPIDSHFPKVVEIYKSQKTVWIIMEDCPSKSLADRLSQEESLSGPLIRKLIVGVLQGVIKLQSIGIAHRCLRLDRVLYTPNDEIQIVGWTRSTPYWDPNTGESLLQSKERKCRLNAHLPPECFSGVYDPRVVDIWSVGVMMVAMHTGKYVFNPTCGVKFSAQWRSFFMNNMMNRYLRAACNQCFWIAANQRVNPEDFIKHKYFTIPEEKLHEKLKKTTVDPKYDAKIKVGPAMKVADLNDSDLENDGNHPEMKDWGVKEKFTKEEEAFESFATASKSLEEQEDCAEAIRAPRLEKVNIIDIEKEVKELKLTTKEQALSWGSKEAFNNMLKIKSSKKASSHKTNRYTGKNRTKSPATHKINKTRKK